jgi:hypothetical protein
LSVINKMLRDLDQRQVPDDNGAVQPGVTPLRSGTASVSGVLIPTKPSRNSAMAPAAIAAAVLAVCGGAAWWWMHKAPPEPRPKVVAVEPAAPVAAIVQAVPNAVAAPASAVSSAAPMAASSAAAKPAVTASALAVVQAVAKAPQSAASLPASLPSALPVQPPALVNASAAQAPVHAPPPVVVSAASVAAPPKSGASDVVPIGQRQQQAAREAQAQAQALWNSGAHDNAIDLLQQAVATAERSAQSAPGAQATQALASLVRELSRMQVAQGRPGATVDMLARLEPLLSAEPDIWAMRANAAQRAGRHQESVNAYTTALQARPSEQRWLLGAAVSSAALGLTSNAAALAEKAAAVGPVPKDVQAYLRQLGVPLKD